MATVVTCKGCGAAVTVYEGEDPHAKLTCDPAGSCCPEDHHHGIATATTGVPCRSVTHLYIGEQAAPGTGG